MSTVTPEVIRPRGKMVNSFDPSSLAELDPGVRSAVERRMRLLGPAYRLFYQRPVDVVRGEGVYLYDKDGRDYLDAYNNVVPAGHCHPRIVAAVTQQLRTLNTNTRYLQEGILKYAEDLLSTLDNGLHATGQMMFTCTGSESNDLAMRIAQHQTGRQGVIVTSEAYHGNSSLVSSFSPSLGKNVRLGAWVRRVPTPDSYRLDGKTLGRWLADQVALQIADLESRGEGLAAFIVDSLFSSDGIFHQPVDLLAPVADVVRQAGGLFIADEVQSGFGRTGEKFWGYQRHGIDPDIVTMGKPMGNGFPVAAIAVGAETVARFGHDLRYFNTFGGNSTAIAAAQATLDVIREERLQENAGSVGMTLEHGLRELARRHERIGDIRGTGLYYAVELVQDRTKKTPDAAATTKVVNGLRERRVLISACGFHANILKIRPPLVFSEANVDRLLSELDAALAAV
jgi:4-aminobutyrate aminotransferase-like enzyme